MKRGCIESSSLAVMWLAADNSWGLVQKRLRVGFVEGGGRVAGSNFTGGISLCFASLTDTYCGTYIWLHPPWEARPQGEYTWPAWPNQPA